ncbi:hypothetical protein BKA81DRAFT_382939 [Phyllosticta paracitricarpa]
MDASESKAEPSSECAPMLEGNEDRIKGTSSHPSEDFRVGSQPTPLRLEVEGPSLPRSRGSRWDKETNNGRYVPALSITNAEVSLPRAPISAVGTSPGHNSCKLERRSVSSPQPTIFLHFSGALALPKRRQTEEDLHILNPIFRVPSTNAVGSLASRLSEFFLFGHHRRRRLSTAARLLSAATAPHTHTSQLGVPDDEDRKDVVCCCMSARGQHEQGYWRCDAMRDRVCPHVTSRARTHLTHEDVRQRGPHANAGWLPACALTDCTYRGNELKHDCLVWICCMVA